jgi:hypothetical protein
LTACTFFLLELSERLSPDFSTVKKLHEVRELPPMKDQQGKYSNESGTETGKKPPDFLKQA